MIRRIDLIKEQLAVLTREEQLELYTYLERQIHKTAQRQMEPVEDD